VGKVGRDGEDREEEEVGRGEIEGEMGDGEAVCSVELNSSVNDGCSERNGVSEKSLMKGSYPGMSCFRKMVGLMTAIGRAPRGVRNLGLSQFCPNGLAGNSG
jgi:hypothetical protein